MLERDWSDRPLEVGDAAEWPGLRVLRRAPGAQLLVTGDLEAALTDLAPDQVAAGLMEEVGAPAVIRQARDRALFVQGDPWPVVPGWHRRYGVSDAGQAWACFALTGERAPEVLAQGTGTDLGAPSPAATLRFAGRTAMLVRQGGAVLLWGEAGMASYLTGWLGAAAEALS